MCKQTVWFWLSATLIVEGSYRLKILFPILCAVKPKTSRCLQIQADIVELRKCHRGLLGVRKMDVVEDDLQLSTLGSDIIIDQMSKKQLWDLTYTTVQKVLQEAGSGATDAYVMELVRDEIGRDDPPDSVIWEAIAWMKLQPPDTQASLSKQGELPKAPPNNSPGPNSSVPQNQYSINMIGSPAGQESFPTTPRGHLGRQQSTTTFSDLANVVFSTPAPATRQTGSIQSDETNSFWFDSQQTRKNTDISLLSTPILHQLTHSFFTNSISQSGSSRFSRQSQSPVQDEGFFIHLGKFIHEISHGHFFAITFEHLNYCFDAAAYYLSYQQQLPYPNHLASARIRFAVEWMNNDDILLGYAATIPLLSLSSGLGPFAIQAALRARVPVEDLKKLTLRITEMSCLRRTGRQEWILGVQGIIVQFDYEGSHYSSFLMPNMISRSGWSRIDALIVAVRRSKFKGPTELVLPHIQLIAFKTNSTLLRHGSSIKVVSRVQNERLRRGHIMKFDHK